MLIVCTGGDVKDGGMEVSRASFMRFFVSFFYFFSFRLRALREAEETYLIMLEEYNHLYVSGLLQM